jgi:hypothetical protein
MVFACHANLPLYASQTGHLVLNRLFGVEMFTIVNAFFLLSKSATSKIIRGQTNPLLLYLEKILIP